jgi:4-amino-4-deoxy-L-arabinose transferase-like glycosyltransferase
MSDCSATRACCHLWPDDPYFRRWLLLILTVAFLVRCATAIAVDQYVHAQGRQFLIEGDANGYWQLAISISEGNDYSIYQPPRYVLRMPGFPLLLSASIVVFGQSTLAASIVLAGVGTSCCWLTWILARKWTDERTSLFAVVLTAFSPLQIGNSVLILSETWFAFWLLLGLISFSDLLHSFRQMKDSGSFEPRFLVKSLVTGIVIGIGVLVRPGWLLWTGVSALLLIISDHQRRLLRFMGAGLIVAGCVLALSPWAHRNSLVTGHWIFTSLWSGPSLYDGLHPKATGASDMRFFDEENLSLKMSEFDVNETYKRRAWDFVAGNPIRAMELGAIKALRYLSPFPNAEGVSGSAVVFLSLVFYVPFVFLIFAGLPILLFRGGGVLLLAGPFLQFLLVHMVFVGSVRYRLPVEFPLSVIAAAGISRVWNVAQNHNRAVTSGSE